MIDFEKLHYLKTGNERQKLAHQVLVEHQIFELLEPFDPLLTGTIPIHIDMASSDLDICCYYENQEEFASHLSHSFGKLTNFKLKEILIDGQPTIIANFLLADFEIEIFGQNIPSRQQNAFKHLLIEHQILQQKGEKFRTAIINLKLEGYKTEPAFAKLLGLTGDPYVALLAYPIDLR